jgi:tetratricopeptide (TPR) repeat protein
MKAKSKSAHKTSGDPASGPAGPSKGVWLLLLIALALVAGIGLRTVRNEAPAKTGGSPGPGAATVPSTNAPTPADAPPELGPTGVAPVLGADTNAAPELDIDKAMRLMSEGNELLAMGKAAEAVARYQESVRLDPEVEDAHYNLAIALARVGKIDEAIHHYEEALKILPDYAEAHNNMGNLLVKKGEIEKGIAHFQEALRILPDHASAHNNLGTALGRQGRVSEAILHFSDAARIQPDYVDALYNLGSAYLTQNRAEEAAIQFSTILKFNPEFEPALRGLARARQKLGRR